jgi:hypothetical protein
MSDTTKINTNTAALKKKYDTINAVLKSGRGLDRINAQIKAIRGFNYFKDDFVLPDTDNHGFTFISRPHLNMRLGNVRANSYLNFLNTLNPASPAFAIRCLLDPDFAHANAVTASKSTLFDIRNPFIPILTNRLKSMSGWPDMVMETETTEGGFFSENITLPIGWDNLNKSYDLTLTFSDVKGGYILALFFAWFIWIDAARKGNNVVAYQKYIEERRMCFTFSIYRFLLDETGHYITKWAKATGTFPLSVPMGAYFNFDKSTPYAFEGQNLSIPVKVAGRIEYMKPEVFTDFNILVHKYCPNVTKSSMCAIVNNTDMKVVNNKIIPYIDLSSGKNELVWMADKSLLPEDSASVKANVPASTSSTANTGSTGKSLTSSISSAAAKAKSSATSDLTLFKNMHL